MSDAINPPSGFEPPQGPPISDDDADAILGGSSRPGHEDLAQVIADLRSVPQPLYAARALAARARARMPAAAEHGARLRAWAADRSDIRAA